MLAPVGQLAARVPAASPQLAAPCQIPALAGPAAQARPFRPGRGSGRRRALGPLPLGAGLGLGLLRRGRLRRGRLRRAAAAPAAADEAPDIRVAFQGERCSYSEQAIFELLGRTGVRPVSCVSFDDAFAAATAGEADLLMVPIENNLGGTIHANCDLQLQHSLFIIAEHHFRVEHCLMALPGTKKADLKKVISHPQALAQCDSYIKQLGVPRENTYDTAGSAKMIAESRMEGVAAICSELAAPFFGLEILEKGIQDDSNNFTRFLLLRKDPVHVPSGFKCKTSIVFSLDNNAGALFKALSAFSLRGIDLCKIESRPCKPDIMEKLERLYKGMSGMVQKLAEDPPPLKRRRAGSAEYPYLFYVDFFARLDESNTANAIRHLQEMAAFFRVLGSYPCGGAVAGLENLGPSLKLPAAQDGGNRKMRVGIMGFGNFGQFIGKKLAVDFDVFATNRSDCSEAAARTGVIWCRTLAELIDQRLDVLIISVSILSFESMLRKLVQELARTESAAAKQMLIVDVLSVKVHAKTTMMALLPESCDILCTHPMFGPESGKHGWSGLPFAFDRVRLRDARRCEDFVHWWSDQGCRMIDMTCELHDECAAGSQFVTHFTGRVLAQLGVKSTPINTKGFQSLLQLVDNTVQDSFDLFYALYKHNPNSAQQLQGLEAAVAKVSQELRHRAEQPDDS